MNDAILSVIDHLNQFQGRGYKWTNSLDGSVGDVLWDNRVVLKGNPKNYTYCCGLTLQVFLMACAQTGKFIGSFNDVLRIKRKWFIMDPAPGPLSNSKGPVDALVPKGLGVEVPLEHAIPGDLVQLWRESGSGHSVILIDRVENGIKYWSTQPSTNGIGYRTEYFSGVSNPITHAWVCRPNETPCS